jgi:hypothetical protein
MMGDLDFLKFKEFDISISLVCNELGSGGWEVIMSQGSEKVALTSDQLNRLNKKVQDYIAESINLNAKAP